MLFASMIGVTINFYTGLDVDFNDIKIDFKYGEIMILITVALFILATIRVRLSKILWEGKYKLSTVEKLSKF